MPGNPSDPYPEGPSGPGSPVGPKGAQVEQYKINKYINSLINISKYSIIKTVC